MKLVMILSSVALTCPPSKCPSLRAFFRLTIGDPSPETLEIKIKQQDLGISEGPAPVGPQQFYTPKALISKADNLELVQKRTVMDEAEKRLHGKRYPKRELLGAGKNPWYDIFGYGLALGKGNKGKRS